MESAADKRDSAERAEMITAVRDAEIGAVFGGRENAAKRIHRLDERLIHELGQFLGELRVIIDGDDEIRLRDFFTEVFFITGGKASADDEFAFAGSVLQNDVDRLFFRGFDEPACIDDDQIGVVFIVRQNESVDGEHRQYHFGIDAVFRAS